MSTCGCYGMRHSANCTADIEPSALTPIEQVRAALDWVRGLDAGATGGPWRTDSIPETGEYAVFGAPNRWHPDPEGRAIVLSYCHGDDAEFIAVSRNLFPLAFIAPLDAAIEYWDTDGTPEYVDLIRESWSDRHAHAITLAAALLKQKNGGE